MNILYLTCGRLHPTQGGTERTTITIATALRRMYGANIYSLYERPTNADTDKCLDGETLWSPQKSRKANVAFLRKIVLEKHIDAVIVQGAFIHVPLMREAITGLNCRLLFAHHFRPGFEFGFHTFKGVWQRHPQGLANHIRWLRDIMLYPRMHRQYLDTLKRTYAEAYSAADKVILLTDAFIKLYKNISGIDDDSKFTILPNALSFDTFINPSEISKKKKSVLIVARLDEMAKNISTALRIWSVVKECPEAKDFVLNIVGHGNDEKTYQWMVKIEGIPHVVFHGRQDPIPYYKEASIFMMTSHRESWGLTLTEAQQMGVVPIAFDTYESLHDIITDGVNGRIIPAGNNAGYATALLHLMTDTAYRQDLAKAGLQTCRRFCPDKIAARWWQLINNH